MKLKLVAAPLAGILLAGVLLSGCGGAAPQSDGGAATEAAKPSSGPASTTPSADTEATEKATTSTGSGRLVDPCTVITAKQMSGLVGTTIKNAKAQDVMSTKLCVYTPADVTGGGATSVTTQEGKVPAGAFENVVQQLEGQFTGGKSSDIDVAGAETAKLITGKTSGATAVDVIALSNGIYYQALVTGDGSSKDYEAAMTKVAETLIAG